MAYLKEEAKWDEGIYQFEIDDPLQGGENGIDNVQGKALANRTQWLKKKLEAATARTETDTAAKNDYAAGDQFFIGDKLCTATKAITTGDTLEEGVNYEARGTTGAQLVAHKDDKANPHGVTAAQVGAYTKEETADLTGTLADEVGSTHATALTDESKCRSLLDVLGIRAEHSDDSATETEAKECMKALHEKMEAGDFSGLRLGDYLDLSSLTVDGTTYTWDAGYKNLRLMIVGFNTYKHAGDTENTKNHVVMQFRNCVLTRRMNASDTNTGGYAASELYGWLNDKFKTGLVVALGDYLYKIRRLLSNKGGWAWNDDTVFLPTEYEVWGASVWSEKGYGGGFQAQYALYRESSLYKVKRHNGNRMWWWEATPYEGNTASFCGSYNNGHADSYYTASSAGGVAPDSVRRHTVKAFKA